MKDFNTAALVFSFINTALFYLFIRVFSKTRFRYFAVFILSFFVAADVTVLFIYGAPLNIGVLASIFETNRTEASELLTTVLSVSFVSLAVIVFLLIKSSEEMSRNRKLNYWLVITLFILNIAVIPSFLTVTGQTFYRTVPEIVNDFKAAPFIFTAQMISLKYPFVTADPFLLAAYINEMAKFREAVNREKVLPQGIVYDGQGKSPDKIIILLGESSTRRNYSLYGYKYPTTPFMDSLSVNSSLLSFFDNVITPAAFTREAVRITLSFATPVDKQPFYEEKNIIQMANDAGYETFWVSNNGRFDVNDTYMGMIAASADTSIYPPVKNQDDLNLVRIMKERLTAHGKQLFVLHMLGSHIDYYNRYDDIDAAALPYKGDTVDYDRSIHHTDRVIKETFGSVRDLEVDAMIFYYSDHGEVINEGHAKLNKWKSQFEIPLVLIQNNPVLNTDSIVSKYYNKEQNLLNTSSVVYILSEIMGYRVSDNWVEKARKDGHFIFQPDGTIIPYKNIKD